MNPHSRRPIPLDALRAFEAVARRLSFRAAAEELHLTQPAVSRQIKGLEESVGAALFQRGTRHVSLTPEGQALLQAVAPGLDRIDSAVRQIRQAKGRRTVGVTTFASFASLWLMPRLQSFQEAHPDIDIRLSAGDALIDLEDSDIDVALRYCLPGEVPPHAELLFGETLTPVVGSAYVGQTSRGTVPPLRQPSDLARHALLEEDDHRASAQYLSWHHWLREQGHANLQPRRWIYLNFTYQQIQGALSGQGIALARLALVHDAIDRGELVEPFGGAGRTHSPYSYWLIASSTARARPELTQFMDWVRAQGAATRERIGPVAPSR